MKERSIEDIDLNGDTYFHFTKRENLTAIKEQGLKAQIGDASTMVKDKARVCLSRGGKGILGIKNSFIHEFKKLRVCDIPQDYRKYFDLEDFSSTEIVNENKVYEALEKRFKDEIYLIVDAHEGEDFLTEDIHGLAADFDIKGKENHDIEAEKISKVKTLKGDSAFDVIQYIYNRILEKNPGKEDLIKDNISDLSKMMEHIQTRDGKNFSIKEVVTKAIKGGITIEDIGNGEMAIGEIQKGEEELGKDD